MRIRTIKPNFFVSDEIAQLPPLARIFFIGLWCSADREGRLEDRPKRLRIQILPYDDDCDAEEILQALDQQGFIRRYEADGRRYIWIVNFLKHQMPHYKELPSLLPAAPGAPESGFNAEPLPDHIRKRILSKPGAKCAHCGSTERLSVDHIIPRSKGGSSQPSNLQILCKGCNSSKGNRPSVKRKPTSSQGRFDVDTTLLQHGTQEGKGNDLVNGNRKGKEQEGDLAPAFAVAGSKLTTRKVLDALEESSGGRVIVRPYASKHCIAIQKHVLPELEKQGVTLDDIRLAGRYIASWPSRMTVDVAWLAQTGKLAGAIGKSRQWANRGLGIDPGDFVTGAEIAAEVARLEQAQCTDTGGLHEESRSVEVVINPKRSLPPSSTHGG